MSGSFVKAAGWLKGAEASASTLVQLLDRRTESVHRVDGRPVAVWVGAGGVREAVAGLMAGRDPAVWSVRVMEMGAAAPSGEMGTTARRAGLLR